MARLHTLVRVGKRALLEKVEDIGRPARYIVSGRHAAEEGRFSSLFEATRWFDGVEKGDARKRA